MNTILDRSPKQRDTAPADQSEQGDSSSETGD